MAILSKENKQPFTWFVMNAYKCETRIEMSLQKAEIKCFIPRRYTIKNILGKKKKVLDVVIPNIIFVYSQHHTINSFKNLQSRFTFATQQHTDGTNSIMTVPDKEMENFIKLASHYDDNVTFHKIEEINISKGDKVKIIGGLFDGAEGIFIKMKGKRSKSVVVIIDNVMAVAAELSPDLIQVIQ